ncbi:MAG TPA: sigma-70 family RNA polymerase sigma factor [Candidatus Hydrogenedentes bacterium]|nr:sigma-70 family RNA polymerase sigma factor [Candidatus Hydrogenedentota bacterium]HIJ73855.1 sigma-70 family RNA polymerase sigma factor [Candidatus Hydrogenedentota bacterium]
MGETIATDAALLEASRGGNRQAFAGIVERYKSLLCAVVYSRTGDLGMSEDLAQEAFVRAWTHLKDLRDATKLRSWLVTIACNLARRSLENKQRDVMAGAEPLENTAERPVGGPSPRELAIHKEEETVMWRSLEQIPEGYRVPLILYYREGHSVQRVAQTLGLTPNAVKQRLARGRHMLKAEVAGLVEQSLERTRPGKAFSLAVLAALPKAPLPAAGTTTRAAVGAPRGEGSAARLLPRAGMFGAKRMVAGGAVTVALVLVAAFYLYASGPVNSRSARAVEENALEYVSVPPQYAPLDTEEGSEAGDVPNIEPVEAPAVNAPSDAAPKEPAAGTRVIHFPEDRVLGLLWLQVGMFSVEYRLWRPWFGGGNDEWEYLGPAQGDIVVPADKPVWLLVAASALHDLSPLAELGSHDLYGLFVSWWLAPVSNPDSAIMRHISGLTGLKVLHVSGMIGPGVTANGLRYIEDFKELEDLHISLAPLSDAGLSCLEKLESLEVLVVGGDSNLTDAGLARLAKLTSLQELRIPIDNIEGPGLAQLANIPSLRCLEFYGGNMDADKTFEYLRKVTSLKRLEGRGSEFHLTDHGLAHLSHLANLEELEFVRIRTITDAGMAHLLPLRSLKKLHLTSAQLTDEGLALIAKMESLEDLGLPPFGITDRGLAHVSEMSNLRRLRAGGRCPADSVRLGPYTDRGLFYLSRLKNLEELGIASGIGITDAGVECLAGLPNLRRLSLMANGITDNALATLATMKSLRDLMISQDYNARSITVSGVNHLNALADLEDLQIVCPVVQDNSGLDLSGLTRLKKLTVWFEGTLRDEDVACVGNLTGLIYLQPGYGPTFSDAGMANFKHLKALERLYVGGDLITDKGLSYLTDKRCLHHLTIGGVGELAERGVANITDRGLRYLEDLDALQGLTISTRSRLSPAALDRLYRELPSLELFNAEPVVAAVDAGPPSE